MQVLNARSFCLSVLLLLGALPASAGVVLQYAPNNVFMQAAADTAFVGVVTDAGPPGSATGIAEPPLSSTVTASSLLAPASGVGVADGTLALSFSAGGAGIDDSFSFGFSGIASATSALASDGSPAAAMVKLQGSAMFYLDPAYGGVTAGSFVGLLQVDPLRAASPYEGFSLKIQRNGETVADYGPESAGGSVALHAGNAYEIIGSYQMLVPHGVDPPFTLSLGGGLSTVAAVPEPRSLLLMLAGLAGLGLLVGRRRG